MELTVDAEELDYVDDVVDNEFDSLDEDLLIMEDEVPMVTKNNQPTGSGETSQEIPQLKMSSSKQMDLTNMGINSMVGANHSTFYKSVRNLNYRSLWKFGNFKVQASDFTFSF